MGTLSLSKLVKPPVLGVFHGIFGDHMFCTLLAKLGP